MHFTPIFASFAHGMGYLDPGSGSVLLQVIIAAVLALGILARTQWARIKKLFGQKPANQGEEDEPNDQ